MNEPQLQLHPVPVSLRSKIQVLGRGVVNGTPWIPQQGSGTKVTSTDMEKLFWILQ